MTARSEADGDTRVRLLFDGPVRTRRLLADAMQELFGPVRTPRFLLSVGGRKQTLLAVPQQIGRRRADAEDFAARWHDTIGPCRLVEPSGEEGLVMLRAARGRADRLDDTLPRGAVWG